MNRYGDTMDLFEDEDRRKKAKDTLRKLSNYFDAMVPYHRNGHDTERLAAGAVESEKLTIRSKVLALLLASGDQGLAGFQACSVLGGKESTVRTRLGELVQYGLAYDSKQRRTNPDGHDEVVRKMTDETRRYFFPESSHASRDL